VTATLLKIATLSGTFHILKIPVWLKMKSGGKARPFEKVSFHCQNWKRGAFSASSLEGHQGENQATLDVSFVQEHERSVTLAEFGEKAV